MSEQRLWSYQEAVKAVPYLRSIVGVASRSLAGSAVRAAQDAASPCSAWSPGSAGFNRAGRS